MTWRRYPSYSTRSPATVLGAIASVIAVLAAVVCLITYGSPTVVLITLVTFVLLGFLFMVLVLPAITTPKEEKLATDLPPSAKVVHIHRQKVSKGAQVVAILLVIGGIMGAVLTGEAAMFGWVTGGLALLAVVLGLLPLYFKARNLDRALTAVTCNPWVHWQYSPEQWKQWADVQGERAKAKLSKLKLSWRTLALLLAFIAAGIYIFYPGSFRARTLVVLGICGGTCAYSVWKTQHDQGAPEKLRSNLLKAAAEAYIGRDGLFCDGAFTTWISVSINLTSASIDESPPRSLIFRFEKYVGTNPYGLNFTSGHVPVDRKVLIPTGAESDIARLQQELTVRCPKARIGLA